MSTTSTSDDPDAMSSSSFDYIAVPLRYVVSHVFHLDDSFEKNHNTPENDHSLAHAVCAAAHAYDSHLYGTSEQAQWHPIARMLDNLQASLQSGHMDNVHIVSQLQGMQTGGALAGFSYRFHVENL